MEFTHGRYSDPTLLDVRTCKKLRYGALKVFLLTPISPYFPGRIPGYLLWLKS